MRRVIRRFSRGGRAADLFWSFFTQSSVRPFWWVFGLAGRRWCGVAGLGLGVDNRIKLGEAFEMMVDW